MTYQIEFIIPSFQNINTYQVDRAESATLQSQTAGLHVSVTLSNHMLKVANWQGEQCGQGKQCGHPFCCMYTRLDIGCSRVCIRLCTFARLLSGPIWVIIGGVLMVRLSDVLGHKHTVAFTNLMAP